MTGSSANLLATEVASAFRGRSLVTEILPYDMCEAAVADGLDLTLGEWPPGAVRRSKQDAFIRDYLRGGGFPAVRTLHPYDRVQALQENVHLVVLRDVSERYGATNVVVLRELVAALFASNANGFSVSRLHGALRSQGWKVAKTTHPIANRNTHSPCTASS